MKCENCEKEHDKDYGSGRFCSSECARGFSTKSKRKEINEKVSKTLSLPYFTFECKVCGKNFKRKRRRKVKYCSKKCKSNCDELNEKFSKISSRRCESAEEKIRMREIGRMGGFGTKGLTGKGIRYDSNLEKNCFEYLENRNIEFEAHKNIPNSSKVSDIYLKEKNLWIELDGIDREKRKKWLGKNYEYWLEKIEIYKREKLELIIIKTFEEFKSKFAPVA